MSNKHQLEELLELMENGNWAKAIETYKAWTMSPREFNETLINYLGGEFIDSLLVMSNLTTLGFYCRGER